MCEVCKGEPDCRNHQIEIMLNRFCKGKMPNNGDWARYNRHFQQTQITARGLAVEVYRGYSFSPVFSGRRRKNNFKAAWHVGLDFDSKDERSSLDYLSKKDFIDCFASFGYTTASHTEARPKSRIIWVFPKPITAQTDYEELVRALLWLFPWADSSAKDALRLFFGSSNCQVWDNWSIFPEDSRQYLIEDYRKSKPKPKQKATVAIKADVLPANFIQSKFNSLTDLVRNAPDGEKHPKLIKLAYVLGGYIAGGYFEESIVRDELVGIVDNDLTNIKNYSSAYKTIDDGIADGKRKPLYFERPLSAGDKL